MNIVSQKKRTKRRVLNDGGIYSITCTVNNKVYIGSTVDFKRRWSQHRSDLKKGGHCSPYLQNAYNKYGLNVFDFQVVEHIKYADELLESEQRWIYWYQSHDKTKGFNNCPVAGSTTNRVRESWEKSKISNGLRKHYLNKKQIDGEKTIEDIAEHGCVHLLDLGIRYLKKIAQVFGITKYSYMSKDEIILAIANHPRSNDIKEILSDWIKDSEKVLPMLNGRERYEDVRHIGQEYIAAPYTLNEIMIDGVDRLNDLSIRDLKKIATVFRIYRYSSMSKPRLVSEILSHPRISEFKDILSSGLSPQGEILSKLPPRISRSVLAKQLRELEKEAAKKLQIELQKENDQLLSELKDSRNNDRQERLLSVLSQSGFSSIELFDLRTLKIAAQFLKIKNYSYLTKEVLLDKVLLCKQSEQIKKVLPY